MAWIDHIIVRVDDLKASVAFYTDVLGFLNEGTDGPFALIRVGPSCQLQLAPWGAEGIEHYAFAVSRTEFAQIAGRIKEAALLLVRHSTPSDRIRDPAKSQEREAVRRRSISMIQAGICLRSDHMTRKTVERG